MESRPRSGRVTDTDTDTARDRPRRSAIMRMVASAHWRKASLRVHRHVRRYLWRRRGRRHQAFTGRRLPKTRPSGAIVPGATGRTRLVHRL